jgi:hypothetical protein
MTLGLAGGANKHQATSNKLNLLNLSGLPTQAFVRPKSFPSRLCVFAVHQTLKLISISHLFSVLFDISPKDIF